MAQPFIGEIKLFGGNFAIAGWAFCNGQAMSISQNEALYTLIGTTYGGDGVNTFNLPNLQSRVPVHQGQGQGLSNYVIGQPGGFESVTLTTNQLPSHSHPAVGSATGGPATNPAGATWGNSGIQNESFGPGSSVNALMAGGSTANTGSSQPHDNMLPFLAVTFLIALQGIYPSQS
jgi:microcystin-dependent protein